MARRFVAPAGQATGSPPSGPQRPRREEAGPLAAGQPLGPGDLKSPRRSVVEPADGGPHLARPEMPRLLSAWRKRTKRWLT